jgi:hypothetical protein
MERRNSRLRVKLPYNCPPGKAASLCAGLLLLFVGCATPIQVERQDPREVQRALNSNVISTGDLSEATQIVLHREGLAGYFQTEPDAAIAILHRTAATGKPNGDALFALAEMSFQRAQNTDKHGYFLAAAIYAYAFLFPEVPTQRPSSFDPRLRTASDILQP